MTAMMRQTGKQTLTMALGLMALFALASPAHADGGRLQYVTNPLTGVALDGMDPVSYFTETEPLPGLPDYEYDWHGVPWYFANAANRDVFIKAPEVYAPQFGGHASYSVSRGFLSDGNPQIYEVVAQRLYLFYSLSNRDAFNLSPAATIADARKHWAELTSTLSATAASQ
jgi:YHS domain-containing protein